MKKINLFHIENPNTNFRQSNLDTSACSVYKFFFFFQKTPQNVTRLLIIIFGTVLHK